MGYDPLDDDLAVASHWVVMILLESAGEDLLRGVAQFLVCLVIGIVVFALKFSSRGGGSGGGCGSGCGGCGGGCGG